MIGIIKWTIMNKTLKGNILFHSDIVPNLWWQQVVFFHCSWDIVSKSVIQKQLTLLTFLSCPFVEVLFFSWRDLVLLTQLFTFLCGCSLKDWHRQKGERAIVDGWKILHDLNVFQTTEKMGKDNPQHGPRIDRYTGNGVTTISPLNGLKLNGKLFFFFLFHPCTWRYGPRLVTGFRGPILDGLRDFIKKSLTAFLWKKLSRTTRFLLERGWRNGV